VNQPQLKTTHFNQVSIEYYNERHHTNSVPVAALQTHQVLWQAAFHVLHHLPLP
jgi:hypothetical protein